MLMHLSKECKLCGQVDPSMEPNEPLASFGLELITWLMSWTTFSIHINNVFNIILYVLIYVHT